MKEQGSIEAAENLQNELDGLAEFLKSDEQIPELSEETLSCLYAAAYEFYVNGKFETARHYFHVLTVVDPYSKKNWMGLGATHQAEKNYSLALEAYSLAAVYDLEDPYISFHAAECFFFLDKMEKGFEALDAAEEILADDTDHPLHVHLKLMRDGWQNYMLNEGKSR